MHAAWTPWNASPPPAPAVLRRPVGKLPERALLVNGVRHVGQRSGKGEREGTACAGKTAAAPHFKDGTFRGGALLSSLCGYPAKHNHENCCCSNLTFCT